MIETARIPSSPPALHCLASDGRSSQATAVLEIHMIFLKKSDLKKHLSTKNGPSHPNQSQPSEGSRVILRDGNLITLPDPIVKEDATPFIERADGQLNEQSGR
jgi:hypothetical protein